MTKKEYEQDINVLSEKIKELKTENEELKAREHGYMQVLLNYHRVSEELKQERESNMHNRKTIDNLQTMIRQYEKMLDKVTFQVIDGNRY